MNKVKYLFLLITFNLFCIFPTLSPQIENGDIPAEREPSPEEIEKFERLLEKMVGELEEEIKKEEEAKREPAPLPTPTPGVQKPVPRDKRTNFLQSWDPAPTPPAKKPEVAGLPAHKKEAFNHYVTQLRKNLSSLIQKISSLKSYERGKFATYQKDLSQVIAHLGNIASNEIYQISFFDKQFNGLRQNFLRLNSELTKINHDIRVEIEEDIEAEELYRAALEEELEAEEEHAKIEKPVITPPEIPEEEEAIKEEVKPAPAPQLPWYQKWMNATVDATKKTWNYVSSWFSKLWGKEKQKEPAAATTEAKLEEGEKNLFAGPVVGQPEQDDDAFSKLIQEMQAGLEGFGPEISKPGKGRPATPTVTKMALKKFRKFLERGELKQLNNQLKAVIDFSAKAIEEEKKKEEQKVKEAEQRRKQAQERESRRAPAPYYHNHKKG